MTQLAYQMDEHYSLTAHDQVELFKIATEMKKADLADEFIAAAIRTGLEFEGVADLIKMWVDESDQHERDEIIADIQDLINECSQQIQEEFAYIKFNDLDAIGRNIREFKDALRLEVEERGGLKKLAELTHIPQPSLSRFFNTDAMPHRTTLLKIARALNLDGMKIANQWVR